MHKYMPFLYIALVLIAIGFVFLSIHYYWKNEEKEGRVLTPKAQQKMEDYKFIAKIFFISPVIVIPFLMLMKAVGGLMGIIILIGLPGALVSFIKKG